APPLGGDARRAGGPRPERARRHDDRRRRRRGGRGPRRVLGGPRRPRGARAGRDADGPGRDGRLRAGGRGGGRGPRRLAPGARRLAGARRPVGTASRHRDLHRHRRARPARSAAGVVGRVAAHRGRPHRRGSAVRRSPARAAGRRSPLTGRPRPEVPIGPGAGNPAAVAVVQPGMDRLRPLLALLVVATAAACAGDRDETIVDDDPWVEEPEPRAPGTPGPAEPVALVDVHHAGGRPPGAPTAVLVDEHDRMAYPGWFAADHPDAAEDIADVLAAPDPDPGTVLVAATVPLECDSIGGVELLVAGSDIAVVPTGVTHHEECAGHRAVVAILEVDRSDLPASPTVDGEPVPVPPGPGELLAAVPLGPGEWDVPPADLADGRAAGSFTAALPADAVTAVEQAVD